MDLMLLVSFVAFAAHVVAWMVLPAGAAPVEAAAGVATEQRSPAQA